MTRKTQERIRKTTATLADPNDAMASNVAPAPILILHLRLRTKDLEDESARGHLMQDQLLVYRPTFDEPEAYDRNPFSMAEELADATDHPGNPTSAVHPSAAAAIDTANAAAGSTNPTCSKCSSGETHPHAGAGAGSHGSMMGRHSTGCAVTFEVNGACWWCCHGFEGDAVHIPLEGSSTPSYGYGTFCSFPCACAYLFGEEEMSFRRWERFSLLCSDYRKMGGRFHRVPQAPPRQTLKMFGGTLPIDEFRKLTQRECAYRVVTPTLVHVQPTISVVPLHQMHVSTVADVAAARTVNRSAGDEFLGHNSGALRLKRSKPILDGKNTLEHYIQGKK